MVDAAVGMATSSEHRSYVVKFEEDAMRYCVHRRDLTFVAKEAIQVTSDVVHDPTLPRDKNFDCHICGNNEAVFYRLAESIVDDAMALVFVCCNCYAWKTDG